MPKLSEYQAMTDDQLLEVMLTAGAQAPVAMMVLQARRQDESAKRIERLTIAVNAWTVVVAGLTLVSTAFVVLSALHVFG